jgi:ribA/ribD-fused uncharacterized protein
MRETDTHIYFWGGMLSNFYPHNYTITSYDMGGEPLKFHSSEQQFMYFKARHFNDDEIAEKILQSKQASEAKKLGRQVKNFDEENWADFRFDYMIEADYCKFSSDKNLREYLTVDTGNKILVEASPFDTIWGVGLHFDNDLILDEKNWHGQNLLGEALMIVRDMLR